METETGVMHPQAKQLQGLPTAARCWERGIEQIFPKEEHVDIRLLVITTVKNKLVLFQTTKLVIICYSSPKETNTMGIQLTNSEKEMVGERENSKGQKSW